MIEKKLLTDTKLIDMRKEILGDIERCLRKRSEVDYYRILTATYLLANVGNGLSYEETLASYDHDDELHFMIDKDEFKALQGLCDKYPPEAFAVAAMTSDLAYERMQYSETPESVTKLALRLLDIQENDKVIDLCCGGASVMQRIVFDYRYATLEGYDMDSTIAMIGNLRMHLLDPKAVVKKMNVFTMDDSYFHSYDKVFINYPWTIQMQDNDFSDAFRQEMKDIFPTRKSWASDWLFNLLTSLLLKDTGKAICIARIGSTWNHTEEKMRQYFVEKGLIETVILLPGRMFNDAIIETALMVISHGNQSIRLIDARNICHEGRRKKTFKDEDIDNIMSLLTVDSDSSKSFTIEDIRNNHYYLSLPRYMWNNDVFENGVPFGTVITNISRGASLSATQLDEMVSPTQTDIQYLMLVNIQNGIIDKDLPYLKDLDKRLEKYCIHNNNLIISKNGNPFRIAVAFVEEGKKILANGNLFIITLDEEKVVPYYLKACFESEYGIKAIQQICAGSQLPNIGVERLKQIIIPLPDLDEQNKIAHDYLKVQDEVEALSNRLKKATAQMGKVFPLKG